MIFIVLSSWISAKVNIINNITHHGISIEGNIEVDILSNVLQNITKNVIYLRGGKNAMISNNTIRKADCAFRLDGSQYKIEQIRLGNNMISDTKRIMRKTKVKKKDIIEKSTTVSLGKGRK